jgi:type II secretory pathway component PulF
MATFVYDAIDPVGRSVKGKISADSENLVLSKLHDQKFHVLSVQEQKSANLSFGGSKGGRRSCNRSLFSRASSRP